MLPSRGRGRADVWYVRQVAGFVWRRAWLPGVLLAASVLGREALDWWLSPTTEFYARATVSTWLAISIFVGVGWWSAWRSRSLAAGALAGLATGVISAIVVDVVSLVELALWHDPHTMRMIAASGGVEEVFLLPPMVVVPGTICAWVGGAFGKMAALVFRSHAAD